MIKVQAGDVLYSIAERNGEHHLTQVVIVDGDMRFGGILPTDPGQSGGRRAISAFDIGTSFFRSESDALTDCVRKHEEAFQVARVALERSLDFAASRGVTVSVTTSSITDSRSTP